MQLVGGLEKLSRGRKKFLASGWTLKLTYAPHIQDLTSGWKSFGPYAKHMPRVHIWLSKPRLCICAASIKHKETSMSDESIDAQNRADEITSWLNDFKVSVALRICHAYTKKKLSSLNICLMQMLKTMRKVMMQIMSWTTRMKKKTHEKDLMRITWVIACWWACHKLSSWFRMFCAYAKHRVCRRIFARLAIHDIRVCVICDCAVFSMLRSSCAYARLQYFALAVYLLATLTI